MPRLTLFLGGGGVGKTTLSAALGLARARAGERVGLLSVDPARRLRSALHLDQLNEAGVLVPSGAGELRAAILEPNMCLRRWAAEANADTSLLTDPFFLALADRLAAATDAIAAARAAEWAERDPDLDELIIDTAPGIAGIELATRPEKLLSMLQGRAIGWIRHGGGRIFSGLTRISGVEALERFGSFLAVVDAALHTLVARLKHAKRWLREARILIVATVNEASLSAARDIQAALELPVDGVILNRVLPRSFHFIPSEDPAARSFANYVEHYRDLQQRIFSELSVSFGRTIELPQRASLDLDGLAELGNQIPM